MTNGGGGKTEREYALELQANLLTAETLKDPSLDPDLSSESGTIDDFRPRQQPLLPEPVESSMVLSYSPFASDATLQALKEGDRRVLVIGDPPAAVMKVARAYGFRKAVHINDYCRHYPSLNPFQQRPPPPSWDISEIDDEAETAGSICGGGDSGDDAEEEPFHAICVFTDPLDFFGALQVATDVLLSSRPAGKGAVEVEAARLPSNAAAPSSDLEGAGGNGSPVPLFFSNPDLLWKTQHPFPRFGQGAFRASIEAVYKERLRALHLLPPRDADNGDAERSFLRNWRQYGKPEVAQFQVAERAIEEQLRKRAVTAEGGSSREVYVSHYYMVGDNPASDMAGARNINAWKEKQMAQPKHDASRQHQQGGGVGWTGVLVCTGVYNGGIPTKNCSDDSWRANADRDITMGARLIVEDVVEAVDTILEENGLHFR